MYNIIDTDYLKSADKIVGRGHLEEVRNCLKQAIDKKKSLFGLSILHIKDDVEKMGVDIQKLSALGVITDWQEFKTYLNEVLSNQKDYSRQVVKSLYNGIERLLNRRSLNQCRNNTLNQQIDYNAGQRLVNAYGSGLPYDLQQYMKKALQQSAERIARNWIKGEAQYNQFLTQLISNDYLEHYVSNARDTFSDDPIRKQINDNKITLLLEYFKQGKLGSVDSNVAENVKNKLLNFFLNGVYDNNQVLVAALNQSAQSLKAGSILSMQDYKTALEFQLQEWMNNQSHKAFTPVLDKLVKEQLGNITLSKEDNEAIEIEAVNLLIEQVRNAKLSDSIVDDQYDSEGKISYKGIHSRFCDVINTNICKSDEPNFSDIRESLLFNIALQLIESAKKNTLDPNIQADVLRYTIEELQEIRDKLTNHIFSNVSNETVEQLSQQVKALESSNQYLQKIVAKLEQQLNVLFSNATPPKYTEAVNSSEQNTQGHDQALRSFGSFFGDGSSGSVDQTPSDGEFIESTNSIF